MATTTTTTTFSSIVLHTYFSDSITKAAFPRTITRQRCDSTTDPHCTVLGRGRRRSPIPIPIPVLPEVNGIPFPTR
jgi:hypothetical protein